MNVINVDTNLMIGSFLSVKNIIGCVTQDLKGKQTGMDPKTTVYVHSKHIKRVQKSMEQIHRALSVHGIPHSYSLMHERINL